MKKLEKAEPKKLEPSMFQQMINQMVINPDDDDDEEEEVDEQGENEKEKAKAEKIEEKENLNKLD